MGVGSSCKEKQQQQKEKKVEIVEIPEIPLYIPTFHIDSLLDQAAIDTFKTKYSEEEIFKILSINRLDTKRFRRKAILIVPDSLSFDYEYYAPYPTKLQIFDTINKIILISKEYQAFGAYENGKLVHWGPLSSGKRSTPTPSGIYHTNWKIKEKYSTVNNEWLLPWYFNIDNFEGIALHQYDLPGVPASHSCVRLLMDDAIWFYNWAEQWQLEEGGGYVAKHGTPVIVFGDYNYDTVQPWLFLNDNKETFKFSNPVFDSLNLLLKEDNEKFLKKRDKRLNS